MEKRELVRDMVVETRLRLRDEGWAVGKEKDIDNPKGRSVSIKIRVHKDLRYLKVPPDNRVISGVVAAENPWLTWHRKTIDFIETVLGDLQDRNIDFLTIHPRTRSTPSTAPINLESLELLTNKYGDRVPILVSGDVFTLKSLPYTSPYLLPAGVEESKPLLPKLAGLMSARALLANPALFAGYEACPWEAVELFMNKVIKAPLPFKLVQHHRTFPTRSASGSTKRKFTDQEQPVGEMCGPGFGPDKTALLNKTDRKEMYDCTNMCELIDFLDEKRQNTGGQEGIRRNMLPPGVPTN